MFDSLQRPQTKAPKNLKTNEEQRAQHPQWQHQAGIVIQQYIDEETVLQALHFFQHAWEQLDKCKSHITTEDS